MWPASGATAATKDRCSASGAIGRSKRCSTSIARRGSSPGREYRYSNFGWILVSAAVEAAADEPFLSFMHKQIFEPLGMRHTEADVAAEPMPDVATSYFPRFAADPRYGPDPMRPIDLSCYAGSSVFLSTPSDLVRFAMAINSGKLLQPATVDIAPDITAAAVGAETGYGLGWDLETVTLAGEQTRWVGHDGMLLGGMVASLHDVSRTRARRRGDVKYLVRRHRVAGVEIAQAFADHGRP